MQNLDHHCEFISYVSEGKTLRSITGILHLPLFLNTHFYISLLFLLVLNLSDYSSKQCTAWGAAFQTFSPSTSTKHICCKAFSKSLERLTLGHWMHLLRYMLIRADRNRKPDFFFHFENTKTQYGENSVLFSKFPESKKLLKPALSYREFPFQQTGIFQPKKFNKKSHPALTLAWKATSSAGINQKSSRLAATELEPPLQRK